MRRALAILATAAVALGALALPAEAGNGPVAVRDNSFAPTTKTIRKGQRVTWVWRGVAPHNVVKISGPGRAFQSRVQRRGRYSRRFTRRGTYRLLCTIHAPSMRMKVVVR